MDNKSIERIMKSNLIVNEDEAQSAIDFVRDLIDGEVEWLKKNQPQAYNTIAVLEQSSYMIADLLESE